MPRRGTQLSVRSAIIIIRTTVVARRTRYFCLSSVMLTSRLPPFVSGVQQLHIRITMVKYCFIQRVITRVILPFFASTCASSRHVGFRILYTCGSCESKYIIRIIRTSALKIHSFRRHSVVCSPRTFRRKRLIPNEILKFKRTS